MKRRNGVVGLLTVVGGLGVLAVAAGMGQPAGEKAAAPAAAKGAAKGTVWSVDPVHSSIGFRAKHFNTAYFYGRFDDMSGTVTTDESGGGAMDISIKIDSISTRIAKRDNHLKGPDFFNAEKFPTATFKSTKFVKSGENTFDVTGDLTLHGVTKPVTVKAEKTGQGKGQGGEIIGFEVVFDIKRSDFGMTYMLDGLSDEVKIAVAIEAGKK